MTTTTYRAPVLLLALLVCTSCEAGRANSQERSPADGAASRVVQVASAPSSTADTAVAEKTLRAMEAFRATVSGPLPERLAGASPSMDALVARFVEAVESADTAALIAMTMSRGEFIALHYPHSIYVRPPYELLPDDVWFLARAETEKGLTRLLRRLGGQPFDFVRYDCPAQPRREGPNRWFTGCTITRSIQGRQHTVRLFGSIWERDGEFKFGGYGNDL